MITLGDHSTHSQNEKQLPKQNATSWLTDVAQFLEQLKQNWCLNLNNFNLQFGDQNHYSLSITLQYINMTVTLPLSVLLKRDFLTDNYVIHHSLACLSVCRMVPWHLRWWLQIKRLLRYLKHDHLDFITNEILSLEKSYYLVRNLLYP